MGGRETEIRRLVPLVVDEILATEEHRYEWFVTPHPEEDDETLEDLDRGQRRPVRFLRQHHSDGLKLHKQRPFTM